MKLTGNFEDNHVWTQDIDNSLTLQAPADVEEYHEAGTYFASLSLNTAGKDDIFATMINKKLHKQPGSHALTAHIPQQMQSLPQISPPNTLISATRPNLSFEDDIVWSTEGHTDSNLQLASDSFAFLSLIPGGSASLAATAISDIDTCPWTANYKSPFDHASQQRQPNLPAQALIQLTQQPGTKQQLQQLPQEQEQQIYKDVSFHDFYNPRKIHLSLARSDNPNVDFHTPPDYSADSNDVDDVSPPVSGPVGPKESECCETDTEMDTVMERFGNCTKMGQALPPKHRFKENKGRQENGDRHNERASAKVLQNAQKNRKQQLELDSRQHAAEKRREQIESKRQQLPAVQASQQAEEQVCVADMVAWQLKPYLTGEKDPSELFYWIQQLQLLSQLQEVPQSFVDHWLNNSARVAVPVAEWSGGLVCGQDVPVMAQGSAAQPLW